MCQRISSETVLSIPHGKQMSMRNQLLAKFQALNHVDHCIKIDSYVIIKMKSLLRPKLYQLENIVL